MVTYTTKVLQLNTSNYSVFPLVTVNVKRHPRKLKFSETNWNIAKIDGNPAGVSISRNGRQMFLVTVRSYRELKDNRKTEILKTKNVINWNKCTATERFISSEFSVAICLLKQIRHVLLFLWNLNEFLCLEKYREFDCWRFILNKLPFG